MLTISKPYLRLCLALLCGSTALVSVPSKAQTVPAESFFDEFTKIDTKRWYISDGWVNGSYQGCAWSKYNIDIKNGRLQLRFTKSANALRAYRCAEIRTHRRHGYGLYETRMRTAAGSGLNSNMFTYSGPPLTKVHDELDFEFLGKSPNSVQLNFWVNGKGLNVTNVPVPGGAAAAFNNYAIDWQPNSIKWYINGKLVRTATGANMPVTPGQFFLSLWSGSSTNVDWLGAVSKTLTSATAEVEWVAFSAQGTKCLFPQSLSCTVQP